MKKKNIMEIETISKSPNRRPYASEISFILSEGHEYIFDGEACLLLDNDFIIKIFPEKKKTNDDKIGVQKLKAIIEGFSTTSTAEKMGLKLTLALLWTAISRKWYLKLDYSTPQPALVFNRTQSRGLAATLHGTVIFRSPAKDLIERLNEIFSKNNEVDPRLLISMELFSSARLEPTERARFVGLVSSLEPLVIQEAYNDSRLDSLINNFISELDKVTTIEQSIKKSIDGRARSLGRESISQALTRFIKNFFPDNHKIVNFVKDAYDTRSRILHNGTYDDDLDKAGYKLEEIIRYIYSQILQLDLASPAFINDIGS